MSVSSVIVKVVSYGLILYSLRLQLWWRRQGLRGSNCSITVVLMDLEVSGPRLPALTFLTLASVEDTLNTASVVVRMILTVL